MVNQKMGSYDCLVGAGIAIIAGLLAGLGQSGVLGENVVGLIPLVLVILGVVVGFLNIKDKMTTELLIASIALIVLAGTAGGLQVINDVVPPLGSVLVGIVQNLAVFVAPAALIVALKSIKTMAAEQVNPM